MGRLTVKEAIDLIKNAPLKELGKMAYAKKKELHPKRHNNFCS